MIVISIIIWLAAGVVAGGLMYAFWRGAFPEEYFDAKADWYAAFIFTPGGIITLIAALCFLGSTNGIKDMFKYGIKFKD